MTITPSVGASSGGDRGRPHRRGKTSLRGAAPDAHVRGGPSSASVPRVPVPSVHEPRLEGKGDLLGAVSCLELRHGPADVRLRRGGADEEVPGDLIVRECLGHELGDFTPPICLHRSIHDRPRGAARERLGVPCDGLDFGAKVARRMRQRGEERDRGEIHRCDDDQVALVAPIVEASASAAATALRSVREASPCAADIAEMTTSPTSPVPRTIASARPRCVE